MRTLAQYELIFKRQPYKMVKHTQIIIRRLSQTNCLSVFNHFAGMALKGLTKLPVNPRIQLK